MSPQSVEEDPKQSLLSHPILDDIYPMVLSGRLRGLGALLYGSANLILSEILEQS